jgi:sterol desaturase/sphingolipid hydroxylase (fatty acid hydroxylase superfamily)
MIEDRAARWTYYIEFFSIPPIAISLAVFAFMHLSTGSFVSLLLMGAAAWTLLEYWIHRIVLHHVPYFSDQHHVHHQYPKSYIGVHSVGVLGAYAIVGYSLSLIFGAAIAAALIAGIMAMYVAYISIHHRLHHADRFAFGPIMQRLWNHHASHHRGGNFDFGVSTTLWDSVFRTKRP